MPLYLMPGSKYSHLCWLIGFKCRITMSRKHQLIFKSFSERLCVMWRLASFYKKDNLFKIQKNGQSVFLFVLWISEVRCWLKFFRSRNIDRLPNILVLKLNKTQLLSLNTMYILFVTLLCYSIKLIYYSFSSKAVNLISLESLRSAYIKYDKPK